MVPITYFVQTREGVWTLVSSTDEAPILLDGVPVEATFLGDLLEVPQ